MLYEDFHLRLEPDGPEGFRVQARFREQRASTPLALPSEFWLGDSLPGEAHASIARHLAATAGPRIIDRTSPEKVGSLLFKALMSGEVGRLFDTAQGACDENPSRALRLRIHFPPCEKRTWRLQGLPWELLYDIEDRRFYALSRRMPVVRSLDSRRPLLVLPAAPPLRVLVAMANPPDTVLLDLPAERRKIEGAFSRITGIEIVVLEQATLRDLRLRLREKPFFHIVHFMGHGVGFDEESGEGALLLDSPGREAVPLSATGLTEIFEDLEAPRLVVLNACETALTSERVDPVRSVAASLVVAGLPAVLAQRAAISDKAALILTAELYRRLAQGEPVETAVAEARRAMRLEQWGTTAWAIPALFVRPAPEDAPPPPDPPVSLKNLKTLSFMAASLGSLLPGFAFFLDLSPPLLPEVKLLPALAAAAVAMAFAWPRQPRESVRHYKRELSGAASIVFASLLFVLFYIAFYRLTTVTPPVPPPTITCQTGFGLTHLTESARDFVERRPALANTQDLMLAYAAFAGCRTDLIWKRWSILVAGVTLIMLYLTASLLWAFGFACLARLLPHPSHLKSTKATLALILLAGSFCSCMSQRLTSSHATVPERIRKLEDKAKELDDRSAPQQSPAQPNGENSHANRTNQFTFHR